MPYKFDKNEAASNELLPDGDYECYIEKAEFKATKTAGRKKISLQIRVRSDIEQECKNRVLFDDIWSDKETNTVYDGKKINRIMGTQDIPDGKEWLTIQDVVKDMIGINLIAHVVKTHDDYNDCDVNQIKFYKTSEHKPQKLGDEPTAKNIPDDFISDDDIPF